MRTPRHAPLGAVATDPGFDRALTISLVVTLTTVVAAIMVAFLGALAISRFTFRDRGPSCSPCC